MTFSLPDHWVWDFWLADDGSDYHLFYLHAAKSLGDPDLRHRNARFGHATSRDLRSWTDHGPIFTPGAEGEFDETATWTGSVMRGPDGLWRMFYTGSYFPDRSSANIETIGVATSPDLFTWTKAPGPLTRADPRWYETLGTSAWPEEAWRDPWVFADSAGDGWHMLVTARANHGSLDDRGVVGHATSMDLETWIVREPLSDVGAGFAHLEVPQVVDVDGHSLLLFSCDSPKLSMARREGGQRGGVWVVEAEDSAGPYPIENATLLAGESLYAGRLVRDRTGAWVMLAFDMSDAAGEFVGAVSDPQPVRFDEAARRLRLHPLNEIARVQ